MNLFRIFSNKRYLALFLFTSVIMFAIYVLLQVWATGGLQNLGFWFSIIPKLNLSLLIVASILFGLLFTLQLYHFDNKTCSIPNKSFSVFSGGIGGFLALLVPSCPACISLATLILPTSIGISIVKFNTWILILSICLLVLGLYLLNGFKKSSK